MPSTPGRRAVGAAEAPFAHENSFLSKLLRAIALSFRDKQPKSTVVYLPGPPTHSTPLPLRGANL